jgi:hypothetical protein
MFFVGAAGLWCSVRAKTSWRSLLGTLGITYVGGSILSCVALPVIYMVALALFLALMLVERQLGINLGSGGGAFFADFVRFFVPAICITLAVAFAIMAWRFVVSAEYRVGVLERTKHWREEPQHPRWSKHARQRRWEQG